MHFRALSSLLVRRKLALRELSHREGIRPALRAVFCGLFCIPLFNRIKRYAHQSNTPAEYPSTLLTVALILLHISYRLPDPYWLIGSFSFLPLIPVQKAINQINLKETPNAERNAQFSRSNCVAATIGAVLYALITFGGEWRETYEPGKAPPQVYQVPVPAPTPEATAPPPEAAPQADWEPAPAPLKYFTAHPPEPAPTPEATLPEPEGN